LLLTFWIKKIQHYSKLRSSHILLEN
jgi:hypothetical protein